MYALIEINFTLKISFRGYSPPNISRVMPLKISVDFSFPANSSYSLHPIKLKLHV